MTFLPLTVDELLTTTRAVRRRLDFDRPVEPEVIRECLSLALQAPSPGGMQHWHFVVITDPEQRAALASVYRAVALSPGNQEDVLNAMIDAAPNEEERARRIKQAESPRYLTQNLHRAPVLIIPCVEGRLERLSPMEQASHWGGIWPATWSFMLAARSRGLGTVLTTLHLAREREAAALLGIPYDDVTQAALIPVAYTIGTDFKPSARKPLDDVLHWNRW